MRRTSMLSWACALLFSATAALAYTYTNETLVLSTAPTKLPRNQLSSGYEVINNGPHTIWCALGANLQDGGPPLYIDGGQVVRVGACSPVSTPNGHWSGAVSGSTQIWCIAETADQLTTAATVLNEAP